MSDSFRVHGLAVAKRAKALEATASGDVTAIRVNPILWAAVMAETNGDTRFVDVIDENTIYIRNKRVR